MKCYDMDEFVLNQEIYRAEYLETNTIMPVSVQFQFLMHLTLFFANECQFIMPTIM